MKTELSPLQALENLKNLSHDVQYASKIPSIDNELKIIENALNDYFVYKQDYERVMKEKNSLLKEYAKSQKEHKALEIIEEYDITISDFKIFNTFASFNQRMALRGLKTISKEKYDLLKEVLL